MSFKYFTNENLLYITNYMDKELKIDNKVSIVVLNPDITKKFAGEIIKVDNTQYIYRSYKVWNNLAELYKCRLLTPKIIKKHLIELTFEKLEIKNSFHSKKVINKQEKYGINSDFFNINKNEEPTFLHSYIKALESVKIQTRQQVLNLGINKADEFDLIQQILSEKEFEKINFVGIDHSTSTIEFAKQRFPNNNVKLLQHDIRKIDELNLEKSDLIISIGTMQSPDLNYKIFLMELTQKYLSKNGAFILGFPNSRWVDKELIYGASAKNYNYPEMSLLYSDVIYTKKYLQQKKFRVTITGREYIFVTATKIGS